MGMTIDEQINGLRKAAVICTSVFAYDCQGYIKEAIDTLCKYQQLQAEDIPTITIPVEDYLKLLEGKQEPTPTTNNNLGVECVSRQAVLDLIADYDLSMGQVVRGIHALPSVTPQEPQTFKWCTDCKEYDQEKHCCHRWSKVIRDTVEEMKQEQEPILDKIRAEIKTKYDSIPWRNNDYDDGWVEALEWVYDDVIDKYKAETEAEDGKID